MTYKEASLMDCGYYVAGFGGMMYFPPAGNPNLKPTLIPWKAFDEDEEEESEEEGN